VRVAAWPSAGYLGEMKMYRLGVKAKAIMFENGITQTELAGALGVTQSAVCQTLQTASPSIMRAIEIQKYIHLKTGKLYTIDDLFSRYCVQKRHYKQNAG